MRRISILISSAFLYPFVACGDTPVQAVRTSCAGSAFVISADTAWDAVPNVDAKENGTSTTVNSGTFRRVVSCQLGSNNIKAQFASEPPRDRGECAAAPGSNVTIWVNGKLVMQGQLFDNNCYESLKKVSFKLRNGSDFDTEICGHTRNHMYDGCFEFKQKNFWSQSMPFGPFPLTDMIANKSLQATPKDGAPER